MVRRSRLPLAAAPGHMQGRDNTDTMHAPPPLDRPGRTRSRFGPWAIAVSALLHVAALLALLLVRAREPAEQGSDPSYELVFNDGTAKGTPTSPVAADEQPPSAPNPDDAPPPPDPRAEPTPVPPPLEPPVPDAPPESAQPPPAPPTPEPEAPSPVPERPAPPAVRLSEAPPPPQGIPEFVPPVAPDPLPPKPQPRPRPAPASPRLSQAFPAPMDLNYGPAPSRPYLPRGGAGPRSVDLSLGAPKPGPNRSEAFFDARAAAVGADWASGLAAYWRAHRYYPRQAAENGEDGQVQIELTVNRSGKVEDVRIVSRSGSPFLDMAALGTWRGAQLAPFPAENNQPRMSMTLTINYILIR